MAARNARQRIWPAFALFEPGDLRVGPAIEVCAPIWFQPHCARNAALFCSPAHSNRSKQTTYKESLAMDFLDRTIISGSLPFTAGRCGVDYLLAGGRLHRCRPLKKNKSTFALAWILAAPRLNSWRSSETAGNCTATASPRRASTMKGRCGQSPKQLRESRKRLAEALAWGWESREPFPRRPAW